jgi:hypothetical protein
MNSKQRFDKTLAYDSPDRPPLFEDGIRDEVLKEWHAQGLGKHEDLNTLFTFDYREEIEPDLEPLPHPSYWPKRLAGLQKLATHLDPLDPHRLPKDWHDKLEAWKTRDYPLILRVHRGYFLTMGVHGWNRFTDAISTLVDNPGLVKYWMNIYADFTYCLVKHILSEVQVDAVLFSEPIGGNHGPLISPSMYAEFVLESYQPIIEVLRAYGIENLIYRTYANTRALLPRVVNAGFNCLWACECNAEAMDYIQIRKEFGKELSLIGGIDSDALRHSKEEIYREVMRIVPPLLAEGGYIPLVDGRVREDVRYPNYLYYRKLLEQISNIGSHY